MIRDDYPFANDDFDRKAAEVAKSKAALLATGFNSNAELSKPICDRGAVKPSNLAGEMRKSTLLPGGDASRAELGVGKFEPHPQRISVALDTGRALEMRSLSDES